MTIFRDEFTSYCFAHLLILFTMKRLHWLTQTRVDYVSMR